jgi:hypothetical protein
MKGMDALAPLRPLRPMWPVYSHSGAIAAGIGRLGGNGREKEAGRDAQLHI